MESEGHVKKFTFVNDILEKEFITTEDFNFHLLNVDKNAKVQSLAIIMFQYGLISEVNKSTVNRPK